MSKKTKWILTGSLSMLIVVLAVVMTVLLIHQGTSEQEKPYFEEYVMEAGSTFSPSYFMKDPNAKVQVLSDSRYDLKKVGSYPIFLILEDGSKVKVTLRIKDTVPPKVQMLYPTLVKMGSVVPAEQLIGKEQIIDATEVKITYLSKIDTKKAGLGYVSARLEDEGGNVTKVDVRYFVTDAINEEYFYEIGTKLPDPEEFLKGQGAQYAETPKLPSSIGYGVFRVKVFGSEYLFRYQAKDTVAPTAVLVSNIPSFYVSDTLPEPKNFLASVTDATNVQVSYLEEYVLSKAEQRILQIVLTDEGGNTTMIPVQISVFEREDGVDKEPPVLIGVTDLITDYGLKPDYLKGIKAYDGRDGEIPSSQVVVDDSRVRLDVLTNSGQGYPVKYTVKDRSGNVTTVTAYVTVKEPYVDSNTVMQLVGTIISDLKLDGLSRFTQISKIYDYVTEQYVLSGEYSASGSGEFLTEAYIGFTQKRGNYRTYIAMTAILLDELDIDYQVVKRRTTGTDPHAWLLVDYGFGWLHVDPTPIPGYLWTKDNKIVKEGEIDKAEARKLKALTDADLSIFTALSNQVQFGWNYYKIEGNVPPSATKTEDGAYITPQYEMIYDVENTYQGQIKGEAKQKVRHGQITQVVEAVPHIGFKFVRWSDGVENARRTDMAMGPMKVYAIFEIDHTSLMYHTFEYLAGEGGEILGEARQEHIYMNEYTTEVTAVPKEGYYFVAWSDGVLTPYRKDMVKADTQVTAIFAKAIHIEYEAGEGGRIEGNTNQFVKPDEQSAEVEAVATEGYQFVSWSDGETKSKRSDLAKQDIKIIAIFVKISDTP